MSLQSIKNLFKNDLIDFQIAVKEALKGNQSAFNAFPFLLIIAGFFYFTNLGFFSISIDSEIAAIRGISGGSEIWISQGRWTTYFLERYLFPQTTIPFFPTALFCVSLTISYVLIYVSHALKVDWKIYALFPLFCAFPIYQYLAEFSGNLPSAAVGLLFVSVATFLFRYINIDSILSLSPYRIILGSIIQIFCLAIAIGSYQSFILLYITPIFGIILLTILLDKEIELNKVTTMIISLVILTFIALIVYGLINYFLLYLFQIQTQHINTTYYHPEFLLNDPIRVIAKTLKWAWKLYSGDTFVYGVSIWAVGIIMVLGITTVITTKMPAGKLHILYIFMLTLAVLFTPLALLFITGGNPFPLRTLLSLPYVIWFFSVLAFMQRIFVLRIISFFVIVLGSSQILYLSSLYNANKQITQNYDREFANTIYQAIAHAHPDFDPSKPYTIDFFGRSNLKTIYPVAPSSCVNISYFMSGNTDRIMFYMQILGYDNLKPISREKRNHLVPYYDEMPIWPAIGSVKVIDGITLIKLGNEFIPNDMLQ